MAFPTVEKLDFYFYIFIISAVLSTVMGSIIIIEATKIYRQALRSNKWPSTSGKITEVKVDVREDSRISKEKIYGLPIDDQYLDSDVEFKGSQRSIGVLNTSFKTKGRVYDSHIEYQYLINGKEYKGNQQSIGNLNTSSRNKNKVEQQANKFIEGQEVIVYYNSSKPEISSLSVGVERNHIIQFVFGFIFLMLGGMLISLTYLS